MAEEGWQAFEDYGLQQEVKRLWLEEQTGILTFETKGFKKSLYFQDGIVLFAFSNDPADKLPLILIQHEHFTSEQFDAARQNFESNKSVGRNLVEMGLITRKELVRGAREQVFKIFSGSLLARVGRFSFSAGNLPNEIVKLPLTYPRDFIKALLMMQDKEWISANFDDQRNFICKINPDRLIDFKKHRVADFARDVYRLIDGKRDFFALVFESGIDEFMLLKFLYALKFMDLVVVSMADNSAMGVEVEEALDVSGTDSGADPDSEAESFENFWEEIGTQESSITPLDEAITEPGQSIQMSLSEVEEDNEAVFKMQEPLHEPVKETMRFESLGLSTGEEPNPETEPQSEVEPEQMAFEDLEGNQPAVEDAQTVPSRPVDSLLDGDQYPGDEAQTVPARPIDDLLVKDQPEDGTRTIPGAQPEDAEDDRKIADDRETIPSRPLDEGRVIMPDDEDEDESYDLKEEDPYWETPSKRRSRLWLWATLGVIVILVIAFIWVNRFVTSYDLEEPPAMSANDPIDRPATADYAGDGDEPDDFPNIVTEEDITSVGSDVDGESGSETKDDGAVEPSLDEDSLTNDSSTPIAGKANTDPDAPRETEHVKEPAVPVENQSASDSSISESDLMSLGRFEEAAEGWRDRKSRATDKHTLGLFMLCDSKNVAYAFRDAGGDPRFFILPKDFQGRTCYWVCWGEFDSPEEAGRQLGTVPAVLSQGHKVKAYQLGQLLPP